MTPEQYRERIARLVEEIIEVARSRRRKAGIQPLGRAQEQMRRSCGQGSGKRR